MGNPVGPRQLCTISSSHVPCARACVCVFYLVAVYGVLRRPGGDGDGVWLAAAVALTVSVLASLPGQTPEKNNYTLNPLCSHCLKQRTEIDISVTIVQSRCCIHIPLNSHFTLFGVDKS